MRPHGHESRRLVSRSRPIGWLLAIFVMTALLPRSTGAEEPSTARSPDEKIVQDVSDSTWIDDDRRPIQQPRTWEPNFWGHQFREGLIEPLSHAFDIPDQLLDAVDLVGASPDREAVNVNAFDEVPNSSWFTNRNHVRSVSLEEIRKGPGEPLLPTKPWTIKKAKSSGRTHGFQIKDADGNRWLVKLDPAGFPQLGSGADRISRTLLHAAGYNVPHNEPVGFRRTDLRIDEELRSGKEGPPFDEADLDSLLTAGALLSDGSYSAFASLFIPGKPVGPPSMRRLRTGDSNDWYNHLNRRELRGLAVLCGWLNSWDMKDQNLLDVFVETADTLGHVEHYILDVGASLGAAARGGKKPWNGFEHTVDLKWIMRRFVTLGFVVEPWRRAKQESGIPSAGNIESTVYHPTNFRTLVPQAAFREKTDRDGYWGAKLVASFSNAQIAAAVDAVQYEDPRAGDFLTRTLIERRDTTVRYWFGKVAPLDFFSVRDGTLRFHDLAVDIGHSPPRQYEVTIEPSGATGLSDKRIQIGDAKLPLVTYDSSASHLSLTISIVGSKAKPARVELTRKGSQWTVTGLRHG